MTEIELLSCLSGGLFLTEHEITQTLARPLTSKEQTLLQTSPQILAFKFAGRYYYKAQVSSPLTALGQNALTRLAQRPKARKLALARSCHDHLAGQAGVFIFSHLVQREMIKEKTPFSYQLTLKGQQYFANWLGSRPALDLTICLDFSERKFHLGGKLGQALLTQLLLEGKCRPTSTKRLLTLTVPLASLLP